MSHKIQIADSNIIFAAEDGETISQAAEKNGVLLTLGCRMGACGACKSKLCTGEVSYSKTPLALTEEDKKNGNCSVSRNIKIINKEICKRKRLS